MQYRIRVEQSDDYAAVEALQSAAFEDNKTIPSLIRDLRGEATKIPCVSLVAFDAAIGPVGHVMVSHAWVDGLKHLIDVMVLSPIGVMPSHQKTGIGTSLIAAALTQADALGTPMVFLEGSPKYYGDRGFGPAEGLGFRRPSLRIPERAFQVACLSSFTSDMTGTFVYRDVHWRHGVGLYRG